MKINYMLSYGENINNLMNALFKQILIFKLKLIINTSLPIKKNIFADSLLTISAFVPVVRFERGQVSLNVCLSTFSTTFPLLYGCELNNFGETLRRI